MIIMYAILNDLGLPDWIFDWCRNLHDFSVHQIYIKIKKKIYAPIKGGNFLLISLKTNQGTSIGAAPNGGCVSFCGL